MADYSSNKTAKALLNLFLFDHTEWATVIEKLETAMQLINEGS